MRVLCLCLGGTARRESYSHLVASIFLALAIPQTGCLQRDDDHRAAQNRPATVHVPTLWEGMTDPTVELPDTDTADLASTECPADGVPKAISSLVDLGWTHSSARAVVELRASNKMS